MAMPNGQACLRGQAAWWTSAISFDGIVSAKSASAGGRCGRLALSEGAMAGEPAAYFEGLDDGKLIVRVRYTDTEGKHEFRLVLPPRMPIGSHTVPLPDMARMELIRALGVLRELDERLASGEDLPHLTSEE